jgi:hypothetical protein
MTKTTACKREEGREGERQGSNTTAANKTRKEMRRKMR